MCVITTVHIEITFERFPAAQVLQRHEAVLTIRVCQEKGCRCKKMS